MALPGAGRRIRDSSNFILLSQRVQIHCYYGSKNILLWIVGPTSLILKYLDHLGIVQ